MKVRFILLFILAGSFYLSHAYAQLNPQGAAPGIVYPLKENFHVKQFPLDKEVKQNLIREDEQGVDTGVPYRIGYAVPIYTDLFSLGEWIKMDDGRSFFRAILGSSDAKAVNIAFDDFYIPENSQLFFYDPSKTVIYGGYTHADNHESRMFPGPLVEGDKIVIEYFEPDPSVVSEEPVFYVKDIMHYYRSANDTFKNQSIGNSEECNVNINCPEGDAWQNEKRGVARILLRTGNSAGWCTGTLVNNTAQDGTPYFLTAEHCGSEASESDHNLWQFRFNFERPGCEDTGIPATQTITGAELKAITPMDGGSDMRLLELNFTPPQSWQPYYNGWDRSSIPSERGVGIHHPAGDVKKISTYSSPASNVQSPVIGGVNMATNSAWNVNFIATVTDHGATEGGSSGSPLFNQEKLVVGTLTGGSSSCSNPGGANVYGKLNYHWESYSEDADKQLKTWLDPLNTGQLTLSGLDIYPVPKVGNLEGWVSEDLNVLLSWDKPSFPIFDNWYTYAGSYSTVRHETPERATLFDFKELLDVDTFYIKKLSHLFWEHPGFLWEDNTDFTFKIYDQDGETLLMQSEVLTATNFQESDKSVEFELEEDVMVTQPFYVSIVPVNSGQPSSLAFETEQESNSVYGEPGAWENYTVEERTYELLTNVYGSETPTPVNDGEEKNSSENDWVKLGVSSSNIFNSISEIPSKNNYNQSDKSINNIQYYRIYRDGGEIGDTEGTEELSYLDTDELVANQTYIYQVSSIINLNPTNPNSPFIESELSEEIEVTINYVDVNELTNQKYEVFPNPFSDKFTFNFSENVFKQGEIRITVFDSQGAEVLNKVLLNNGTKQVFDLSAFPSGLFYLVIDINGKRFNEKIIKL